jgi:predicted permease
MPLPPGVRPDPWHSKRPDSDVQAEIAFHLEAKIEQLVAQGVPADRAREQAVAEFGPVAAIAADCRDIDTHRQARMSRLASFRGFWLEARGTVRHLARTPGFTALAIGTFGLGIGATAAVSSLFDGVVVKPLPYAHVDRLVRVWETNRAEGQQEGQLTIADFRDWQRASKAFDGFAALRHRYAVITSTSGEVVPLMGLEVSARLFDLLGVRPHLGQLFRDADESEHRGEAVVLSYATWRDLFGADSGIVGRTIRLNAADHPVIGVLPPDFESPLSGSIAVYLANDFDALLRDPGRSRRMHFLSAVARLAPGVTLEAGRAELATLGQRIAAANPETNRGHEPYPVPLQDAGIAGTRPTLLLVLGAVLCLLLITCTNLANLAFARALGRFREFALRRALGAGRWQIARQVLLEQAILAAVGAVLGLGIAGLLVRLGKTALASQLPRLDRVAVDGRAFLVVLVLAAIATVVSGLVPALLAVRPTASGGPEVKDRPGLTRRAVRARHILVSVQAALAALLLVGAGLTAKSLLRLAQETLGFDPDRVVTFRVPLPPARYADQAAVRGTTTQLLERFRAIAGVVRAGAAYSLPMENVSTTSIRIEGQPAPVGPPPEVGYNAADGDYFRTLGIPLLRGRLFGPEDRPDGRPVILVNQALARRFFGGRSPIGARLKSGPNDRDPWLEIVGVVGDIRRQGRAVAPVPELYYPLAQDPTSEPTFALQVTGEPAAVLRQARLVIASEDADLPMSAPISLARVVSRSVEGPTLLAGVLIGFGVLAVVIAAVGIYGLISFLVAEREREIAVRLAVGATGRRVLVETTRWALRPAAAGLVGGLLLALASSSLVTGFLYHVAPADPGTYVLVALVLLMTAGLGALIPSIRASRVEPAAALKE